MTPVEIVFGLERLRDDAASAEHGAVVLELLNAAIDLIKIRTGFSVDLDTNMVFSDSIEIHVTSQQAKVASALSGLTTWESLIQTVYGDTQPNHKKNLYAAIDGLKQRLRKADANHYIQSYSKKGYGICRSRYPV